MSQPASSQAQPRIPIDPERIADSCRKWKIKEFALFGSVLTEEFRPNSDVDVLVSFEEGSTREPDDYHAIHEELQAMFRREVDVVQIEAVTNPYRRSHILRHKQIAYAA